MSGSEKLSYLVPRNPSIKCWNDRVKLSNPIAENVVKLGLDACEDSANEKLKVYLRIKPCQVDINPYCIYASTLEAEAPSDNAACKKLSRNVGKLVNKFHFTTIFNTNSSQETVFETCVLANLKRFIKGRNDLLFAYGTTNAGKTFTMQGTVENPGMIPRAMQFLFKCLKNNIASISRYQPIRCNELCLLDDEELRKSLVHKNFILSLNLTKYQRNPELSSRSYKTDSTTSSNSYSDIYENETFREMEKNLEDLKYEVDEDNYLVWISMIEIYNEQIYDLLEVSSEREMRVKLCFAEDENGRVYIKNLRYVPVANGHEAFQVFEFGRANLHMGPTALNYRSSRSHCICTFTLAKFSENGISNYTALSRFSFCDLAGTERVKKALAEGNRLVESKSINTSLSIFAKCLNVIRENQATGEKRIVPYRESKLTRLFRDAMMGKETFSIIVNVTPEAHLFNETLNVLKFSAVARQIVPVNIVHKPKRVRPLGQRKFVNTVSNVSGNYNINWEGDDSAAVKEDERMVELEDLLRLIDQLKKQLAEERERSDNIEDKVRKEFESKLMEVVELIQKERNLFECENKRIQGVFDREKQRLVRHYEERERKLKRKRMEEAHSDFEEMEKQMQTLTKDVDILKSENISLKDIIQQMTTKTNILQKKCSQMQFELSEKERMINVYRKNLEDGSPGSQEIVKELEHQLLVSKSKNAELKELLDESAFEYKDLLVTNNIIKEENVRLLSDLATTSNVVDDLKKELRDYEIMLSARSKKVEELESRLDESNSDIFIESHVKEDKIHEVVDLEKSQEYSANEERKDTVQSDISSSDEIESSDEGKFAKSLNDSGNENLGVECWPGKNGFKVNREEAVVSLSNDNRQKKRSRTDMSTENSLELEVLLELVNKLKKDVAAERKRADNIESELRNELQAKFAEMIEQQIHNERNFFDNEKRRMEESFDRKKMQLAESYDDKVKNLMAICSQQTETIKSLNEELKQVTDQVFEVDKKDNDVDYEELTARNAALMEEIERCSGDRARLAKLLEDKDIELEKVKRLSFTFVSNLVERLEAVGFRDSAMRDIVDVTQMRILEERILRLLEDEAVKKKEVEPLKIENETLRKNVTFRFELVESPHVGDKNETASVDDLTENVCSNEGYEIKQDTENHDDLEKKDGPCSNVKTSPKSRLVSDITETCTPDRLSREIEKLSILRSETKKSCKKTTDALDKNTHPSLVKRGVRCRKNGKKQTETEIMELEMNGEESNDVKLSSDKNGKGKKCTRKLFVDNDFNYIGDLESSFTEPEIPRLRPRKKQEKPM